MALQPRAPAGFLQTLNKGNTSWEAEIAACPTFDGHKFCLSRGSQFPAQAKWPRCCHIRLRTLVSSRWKPSQLLTSKINSKADLKIMNFILPEARMDILGWVASLSDKISIFRTAPAPRKTREQEASSQLFPQRPGLTLSYIRKAVLLPRGP